MKVYFNFDVYLCVSLPEKERVPGSKYKAYSESCSGVVYSTPER
jgi:hypothetical protein